MKLELLPPRYRALPLQISAVEDGVLLERGAAALLVAGEGAATAVQGLLEVASGGGATEEELCALFPAPARTAVRALLRCLLESGLFVSSVGAEGAGPRGQDSAGDVFYWNVDEHLARVAERIASSRLVILGVNAISRQLARSLREGGAPALAVIDLPPLRDPSFFDDAGALLPEAWPADLCAPAAHEGGAHGLDPGCFGCLVATAVSGGMELLRTWNEHCALHRRPFLPVLLDDCIGWVGPLVIPGETACFECLRLRRSAHETGSLRRSLLRRAAPSGTGGWAAASAMQPMASLLGDLAAVELIKLLGLRPSLSRPGVVLEVDLLASSMLARRVLRLPRCPICMPLPERPTLAAAKVAAVARGRSAP